MPISYHKLTVADAPLYRAIRLESLQAHPQSFGSTYEEQSKLPKLMFEQALESPQDERFLIGAFDGEELIGICGFIPFVPENNFGLHNCGTIIQMVVRRAYNGRKIGLTLINAVLEQAFQLPGIEQIYLEVAEGNVSAIRVYKQAGFVPYHPPVEINDGTRRMISKNI
jgi:diamine N-acetyltransferase